MRSNISPSKKLMNDLGTSLLIQNDGLSRCGLSIHLTPTKRKRKDKQGKISVNSFQGRCFFEEEVAPMIDPVVTSKTKKTRNIRPRG